MPPEKLARLLLTGKRVEHYVPNPELPGHGVRLRQETIQGELSNTFELAKTRTVEHLER
jgi:hypothetical protein